jgi:hypothetical protein
MIFDDRQLVLVYIIVAALLVSGFYLIAFLFYFTCWDLYEGEHELEDPELSYINEDYFGDPDYELHLECFPYRYELALEEGYKTDFRYFLSGNSIDNVYENRQFMQYSWSDYEIGADYYLIFFRVHHMNPVHYKIIRATKKTALFTFELFKKPSFYDRESDRNL